MRQDNFDIKEQYRIAISIAIGALVVALYSLDVTSHDLWSATRGFMLFPGILSVCYLIVIGSYLKYKSPRLIAHHYIHPKIKSFLYNSMINVFWVGIFITFSFFLAILFGWDGKVAIGKYWIGFWLAVAVDIIFMIAGAILEEKENKKGQKE